jgi:hypothetical protein
MSLEKLRCAKKENLGRVEKMWRIWAETGN